MINSTNERVMMRRRAPPVTRQHHVYFLIYITCVCSNLVYEPPKKSRAVHILLFFCFANRTPGQYDIPTIAVWYFTEPDFCLEQGSLPGADMLYIYIYH
jgi:hypothetical protein